MQPCSEPPQTDVNVLWSGVFLKVSNHKDFDDKVHLTKQ